MAEARYYFNLYCNHQDRIRAEKIKKDLGVPYAAIFRAGIEALESKISSTEGKGHEKRQSTMVSA